MQGVGAGLGGSWEILAAPVYPPLASVWLRLTDHQDVLGILNAECCVQILANIAEKGFLSSPSNQ